MDYQLLCERRKRLGLEPLFHLAFWICFIFGEIYSLSILTGRTNSFQHYFSFYLLNISLFYSYVWLLFKIPIKSSAAWFWGLLIFSFELSIYLILAAYIANLLNSVSNQGSRINAMDQRFFVSTLWRGVYFMLFASGYFLTKRYAKQRESDLQNEITVEKLKTQLITAEKNFLRSQINPHLLFNTITFIKHAIKHQPDHAGIALTNLSDIMDYALDTSNREFVLLSKEVDQIENIISLHQFRYGENLSLNYTKHMDDLNLKILPIILLTLVENVFKHGNPTSKEFPIEIKIESKKEFLIFQTINLPSNLNTSKSSETGLENVRLRLEANYPFRHTFKYGLLNNLFFTKLEIDLKDMSS